ncbi:hypothetical protein [uncultured Schumannella sp.]|uniref:hypothetical protein n=1 Tax=uncultured Schumannella sp. TaxID=1195956 RepID=UPI0025E2E337|nr:hypothetical protein [uncultured Schumannella sp.]
MNSTRKWTVVGAASVLGLGVAALNAVSAANAVNFVTTGVASSLIGISADDVRPTSDIPSTLSAVSVPTPTETSTPDPEPSESPVSTASPESPVSAVSALSTASPVSPASPISVESPQSPESPQSAESSD